MTPTERAERAQMLLSDALLKEAFGAIRTGLVTRLESVPIGDVDTQHETVLMLQLLKQLRSQLELYVSEGALEKHKRKQETFMERIREKLA